MTWNDAARATVIALLVAITNGLLFLFNRWLFNTYRIDEAGFEYGYVAVAVLPAALAGLGLLLAGFRSGLWWWLFAPGLLLWALRPLRGQTGWDLDWVFDDLLDYATWVMFHYDRTPDYAFAALNGSVVIAMITAAITGQSIRLTRKALRRRLRDGAIGGPGAGPASGRGGTAQLPQARWASRSEVRARFSHPGGIVLGEMTDPLRETPNFTPGAKRRWRERQGRGDLITMNPEEGNGHVLVLAASAGFKTSGIVIPNILHYKHPIVVFDPKGDLYARTREARKAMGYEAVVIDAQNGFDPFKMIAPLSGKVPSAYYTLAKTLMPLNQRASDVSEYFHEMSVSLFAALTAHYVAENSDNVAHAISKFFNQPREEVIAEGGRIAAKYDLPFINDELHGLSALDDRTFPGVAKGITNKLSFIQFPDIASYATSNRSPEDHLKACDPNTDIFISLPSLAAKDFSPFPRLLIGSMFVVAELMEQPDRPRARRLFLIDEARVLGGMDVLTNVRDAGRSLGMHLMLIYQNLGQVIEAWGGQAGADAWIDSCEARIVSAVGSSRSAADISAMLGKRTIRVTTEGSSSQAPIMAPLGGSAGATENEQLREIPLLTQSELGQLPAHASVIFTRRSKPILATKAIWFTRKEMEPRVKSPKSVEQELDVTKRRDAVLHALEQMEKSEPEDGTTREKEDGTAAHEPPRYPEAGPSQPAQDADVGTSANTVEPTVEDDPDRADNDIWLELETALEEDIGDAPTNGAGQSDIASGDQGEADAQKTLPLAGPADAITSTEPDDTGNPDSMRDPPGGEVAVDQPEARDTDPISRNGITCDRGAARRITPDPDMCRAFVAWVKDRKHIERQARAPEPAGHAIPEDEDVKDAEETDPQSNPDHSVNRSESPSRPEMELADDPETQPDGDDHPTAKAGDPRDDTGENDADGHDPQPAVQTPEETDSGPDAEDTPTEQDETHEQGGEDGDEAGTKEDGQAQRATDTAAVEERNRPSPQGTAQGAQATPQGPGLPDPPVSQRGAALEDPAPAPASRVNTGAWQPPSAFWGELGIPWEQLDFGRKPPLDPERLPRWLRPVWNATGPLRRFWARVMLPTGDIPLNLRPYTMEIIPRPHDATEGSWLLRRWDILDWYLNHPGDRYAAYDQKLRHRRDSARRRRLRAWLWGRPAGRPPPVDSI